MIYAGIDNLKAMDHVLKNKRLGLITNPTGVDHRLRPSIDLIKQTYDLRVLFGPEHGVRGDQEAGVHVKDSIDALSGLKVYSLYGDTRAPSQAMLDEIDVLCFDIQDVGSRFYTYLWTMVYAMEACKKYNKTFVVFDRPNPVGGETVEGLILDLAFRSFVGYEPIPHRYGLTIGELALMVNDQFLVGCELYVVPMVGYQRWMHYEDTGLPFISPSPNIPTTSSCYAYLATCLFEGTNVSEGRGTTKPFSMIGAPWLDAPQVIERLQASSLEGVLFRQASFTPFQSKHQGVFCRGVEMIVTDNRRFRPVETGWKMLDIIRSIHPEFKWLPPYKEGRPPMIDLLTGSDELRLGTTSLQAMIERMHQDSKDFKAMKTRYHLYA